jgi:hypothetical protein
VALAPESVLPGAPPDPGRYPFLAEANPYLVRDDVDGRFEFGLECMIGGLEKRIAQRPAGAASS